MKVTNIKRYLPILSGVEYLRRRGEKTEELRKKHNSGELNWPSWRKRLYSTISIAGLIVHLSYALMAGGIPYLYLCNIMRTSELNPVKQRRKIELCSKLFGKNSYADKDKNGVITVGEKFEVWKRMGLKDNAAWSGNALPEPTVNQLEKAVQSYEAEQN